MNRIIALALLASVAISCRPAATPSEQCRRQNAWKRAGRSYNPDSRLDALEDIRCDELAREERQNAREDAREEAREREIARERVAQQAEATVSIKQSHPVPDLGGTKAEAKALCERLGATFTIRDVPNGDVRGCRLDMDLLFSVWLEGDLVVQVDGLYDGLEIGAVRTRIEKTLGPAEQVTIENGYRVFIWGGGKTLLTSTATGVALITRIKPFK